MLFFHFKLLYGLTQVLSGAVEMVSDTDSDFVIYAANNTQSIGHPFWSLLGGYLDDFDTETSVCDDDDTSAACSTNIVCDYELEYSDLEALDTAKSSGAFPDICTGYYALGVLGSMLDDALVNYTAANEGYDSVFGDYVSHSDFSHKTK